MMPRASIRRRTLLGITAVLLIIALVGGWLMQRRGGGTSPPALSPLAERPDWSALDIYQNTITRADFERLLGNVYISDPSERAAMAITDSAAKIATGEPGKFYQLKFAARSPAQPPPRSWRSAAQLGPAPADKPMTGLRVAIDPGHLGGSWAITEGRWFDSGHGPPVREGDMTLMVAQLLKPKLEALGAQVSMVRSTQDPITRLRPADLMDLARQSSPAGSSEPQLQRIADRLFYRTAEIRARAQLVNEDLHPDLVLCLHFNAETAMPGQTMVANHHFHLLINGGYDDDELKLADQRCDMLDRLLSRTHDEEVKIAIPLADHFAAATKLPPFTYPARSRSALPVRGHPYLWARNLLANRLYQCPVIFLEPYVMNSRLDHPRMQAGDYAGLRQIHGQRQASIFREYAQAVAQGLADAYRRQRAAKPAAVPAAVD